MNIEQGGNFFEEKSEEILPKIEKDENEEYFDRIVGTSEYQLLEQYWKEQAHNEDSIEDASSAGEDKKGTIDIPNKKDEPKEDFKLPPEYQQITYHQLFFPEMSDKEYENKIIEDLKLQLEKTINFEPSGNIISDVNEFLIEIAEREYKKLNNNENPIEVLANMVALRNIWQEIIRNPKDVDSSNEARKLFYIDIPNARIITMNKIINFYLDKFSKKADEGDNFLDEDDESL
jgi:hypothetical protein